MVCALLNTLHAEDDEQDEGISRFKFFLCVAISAFFFYFLPGESLLFPSFFFSLLGLWRTMRANP